MKLIQTIRLRKWAKSHDIPKEILDIVLYFQPSRSVYIDSFKNMEPAPPLSYIGNIIRDNSETFFPAVKPIDQQMIVIGSCPNGDFVVIDLKEDIGSVRYISHEELYDTEDLRSISVIVSDSLPEFIDLYVEGDNFPYDYHEALSFRLPLQT